MSTSGLSILLADADLHRSDLLLRYLHSQSFRGTTARTVADAARALKELSFAAAIVDVSLPGNASFEFYRQLRAERPTFPLIALASGSDFQIRVAALDAGADDALSFPFVLEEFAARLRSLLRRAAISADLVDVTSLNHRDLSVDVEQRVVARSGDVIRLTVKEYDLLLYLLRHKEQVLPRQQILHAVWGDTWVGDDNLLDVYIRYLRKKIERPDLEPLIHTVRGVGFMLK